MTIRIGLKKNKIGISHVMLNVLTKMVGTPRPNFPFLQKYIRTQRIEMDILFISMYYDIYIITFSYFIIFLNTLANHKYLNVITKKV